ncbi:NmrA family NAD(P)-binding protein [Hymenobacter sp. CRA2]|uniref:NmrA family NAD(P)-binding protein n=1 Tax=Hymenobacter sp. CRA2 TaxID=1955620 RepID=UPI00098F59CB|nr:NmrA family NAD(P)-binding protein [Hymenobacter sp. CRA2]OON67126.1 NmrA family protein [Hymenobacter sp. CRA2]
MAATAENNQYPSTSPEAPLVVLAGATGQLGLLIAHHLRQRGARVRALIRLGSRASAEAESLRLQGVELAEVDYDFVTSLTQACRGASCVVSALSGLREVIVEAQTRLLQGAVAAEVPRFIPSDFSADFTKLLAGSNRNFDLRREFQRRMDRAPIQATSILNGMFMDLLKGQAPLIQPGPGLLIYWGDADQPLDFTTMVDTAAFTAAAALDPDTPRYLRVAGDVLSIRGLQGAASAAFGKSFRPLRVGGLGTLATLIKVTRTLAPAKEEIFPPWQGMQYLHNMLSGQAKLAEPLDNARYPDIRWTTVRELLATHHG